MVGKAAKALAGIHKKWNLSNALTLLFFVFVYPFDWTTIDEKTSEKSLEIKPSNPKRHNCYLRFV